MIDELRVTVVVTGLGNQATDTSTGDATEQRGTQGSPDHQATHQKQTSSLSTATTTPQEAALVGSLNNDGTMNYRQLEKPTVMRQNTFKPETPSSGHYADTTPDTTARSSQTPIPPPPPIMTTEYLDIPTFLRQQRHQKVSPDLGEDQE